MLALTSLSDCAGCYLLTQKIAKLEGWISSLYQIQEDECLIVLLATEASRFPGNNTTLLWLGPSVVAVADRQNDL